MPPLARLKLVSSSGLEHRVQPWDRLVLTWQWTPRYLALGTPILGFGLSW